MNVPDLFKLIVKEINQALQKRKISIDLHYPSNDPAGNFMLESKPVMNLIRPSLIADTYHLDQQQNDSKNEVEPKAPSSRLVDGYKLSDLLESPLRPPHPVQTEDKSFTSNAHVMVLLGLGIVLAVVGIGLVLALQVVLGIAFMVLSIIDIAFTVFAPIE